MGTTDALHSSIRGTHDDLAEQLRALKAMFGPPGSPDPHEGPRRSCPPIDRFLAAGSRHLHAFNAVVVPRAQRALPDGRKAATDYLVAARALEVALFHAKAHEYGSALERRYQWSEVWAEIEEALEAGRRAEEELVDRLSQNIGGEELADLAEKVEEKEATSPTRPHPFLPHTGPLGAVSRRLERATDAFWDSVEGRMLPAPKREPHKRPGLVAQYLLGNPRIDDDD